MEVKSRHHLRGDEIDAIADALADDLGVELGGERFEDVTFVESDRRVVLVDGEPLVAFFGEDPFLTVRGANAFDPDRGIVTVDAGAIEFVSDGADVMRPGIVDADPDVEPGDLVVIAEESHGKALAVGRALSDGAAMTGDSGKVVESLHHVGDELYGFTA